MRYALVLLVVLTSCNLFAQKIPFSTEKTIKGSVVIGDLIIGGPSRLFVMDSLLLVQDVRNNGDKFLKVYNLEKGKLSRELGHKGRGPGELMTPMINNVDMKSNRYYLRDNNLKKAHLYDINNPSNPDSIINLDFLKNSLLLKSVYLNDSILLGQGWFKDGLIATVNFKSKSVNYGVKFPFAPFEGPSMNLGRANDGIIQLSPDKKHLIFASMYFGYVGCYKIDGINLSKKWEKWLSKPKYKLDGKRIIYNTRENLMGVMDMTITNSKIYCIYSGAPMYLARSMDAKNSPKTILCFSMEGVPLTKYHTDRPIIEIASDGKDGVYCLSKDPEYNVVRFKL
ncbi:hypothetical protein EYV94_11475 [Puteibacter caeruleilacunae]|nr:hypothetical protein EYV94_11475 [Puteibacter caeruleilacunae]